MKKRVSAINIAVLVVMVMSIAIAGTIAWFSDFASQENNLAFGQVQGSIVEDEWEDNQTVSLNSRIAKNPKVKNDNLDTPAYVRVKVVSSDSRVTVACLNEPGNTLFTVGEALTTDTKVGDWYYRDGYFYYSKILAGGEVTSTLFDLIEVTSTQSEELFVGDLADQNMPFEVYVMAELVQSSGIPATGTNIVDRAEQSFKEMMA